MEVHSQEVVLRKDARPLNLDIYHPGDKSLGAIVILLHGGGWMFGHRSDMASYAVSLAARGFTAIAAEYRLLGEAAWPAQIIDVKAVVAWVADRAASFGAARDKIALMGFSAGGHLALLAAGTQTNDPFSAASSPSNGPIAAVVSAFGPPELKLPPPGSGPHPIAALLGPDASAQTARDASPIAYVSPAFPPTFLLAGAKDGLVPHAASLELFAALDGAGAPCDLHIFHGHAHEFTRLPSMLEPVMDEVALFLQRSMVDPERYARESETLNPFARGAPPPGADPAAVHAA